MPRIGGRTQQANALACSRNDVLFSKQKEANVNKNIPDAVAHAAEECGEEVPTAKGDKRLIENRYRDVYLWKSIKTHPVRFETITSAQIILSVMINADL